MSFSEKGRTVALMLGLFAATSLLFSASALAAGKPTEVGMWTSAGALKLRMNNTTLVAEANPNGAATNVSFERLNPEGSKWEVLATKEIGSGKVRVGTTLDVFGLTTIAAHPFRFTASNSFGSVTSNEVIYHTWWPIKGTPTLPPIEETVGSTGKFRMEFTAFAHTTKVECDQSGSGIINSAGGAKDSISVNTTQCQAYDNGKLICWAPNLSFTLYNPYTAPTLNYPYHICDKEPGEGVITFSEPMQVTPASGKFVNLPVNMTAKASFTGSGSGSVTIESNWVLTGANVGKAFSGIAEE